MNPIFIFDEKASYSNRARQDKAWQGMTRQGQARPDEARRGGAQTRRRPLVLKNNVGQVRFFLKWISQLFDSCHIAVKLEFDTLHFQNILAFPF